MSKKSTDPADYIVPLDINGLQGRMMYLPAPKGYKDNELLMIYGHHSSLERWWGLAKNLNKFGAVTLPDLPGFGGMDSFYTIGKKPDIDTMADYLASFVKWRYKRKKVIIVGLSFGFLVATRMLQKYPDLTGKVQILISAVGFSHHEDFVFSQNRMRMYRAASWILMHRGIAFVFRHIALSPWVLRKAYHRTYNAKKKFAGADPAVHERMMEMEIELWHNNDVRTHWYTTHQMLTVDNCKHQVNAPVWHVSAGADQYFNAHNVEQHMRIIFSDFIDAPNKSVLHAPSVIATPRQAAAFLPLKLREYLATTKKP